MELTRVQGESCLETAGILNRAPTVLLEIMLMFSPLDLHCKRVTAASAVLLRYFKRGTMATLHALHHTISNIILYYMFPMVESVSTVKYRRS